MSSDSTLSSVIAPDYGWRTSNAECSVAYVLPEVLSQLDTLGASEVLDLGCGNGGMSRAMKHAGYAVTGCDADEIGLQLAQEADPGGNYQRISVYEPLPDSFRNAFDVVVSSEVVEHLFSPKALLDFAKEALRDGGHVIVTTPHHGYLKNILLALTNRWDDHHHPLRDGGHIKFWSISTLRKLFESAGFEVTHVTGVGRCRGLWKSLVMTGRSIS